MKLKFFLFIIFIIIFINNFKLFSAPQFTPIIDGIKDPEWGTIPDATSPQCRYIPVNNVFSSSNACQDVYVTDDPTNLYIGYYYNGDATNNPGYPSSRIIFGIITNPNGNTGGTYDPWLPSFQNAYGPNNRPDFIIRQWVESPYDERIEFGGKVGYCHITKGVVEFLKWNGNEWIGAGSVIHYERLTTNSNNNIPAFVVYFKKPSTWATAYIHHWDSQSGDNWGNTGYGTSWPGIQMTNAFGDWYCYVFTNGNQTWLMFTDNGDSVKRTTEMRRQSSGFYDHSTSTWYNYYFNNNWGEIAIPLSALGVKTGDTIKLFYYYRPNDYCYGFSDSTPWDPNASDNGAIANPINSNFSYTIRSDNIKPVIVSNSPIHNSTDIPKVFDFYTKITDNVCIFRSNINIIIEGNEAVLNGIIQTNIGFYGYITPSTISNTNYEIFITNIKFSYNQQIDVKTTIRDRAGNYTEKEYYFFIKQDDIKPYISNIIPAPSSSNNSRNQNIQFIIDDDDQIVKNSIVVTINNNIAYSNQQFYPDYNGLSSQIIPSGNGYYIIVDPVKDFYYGQTINVFIKGSDKFNNTITTNYNIYIIPDLISPYLTNIYPENRAIDIPTNTNISFWVKDNDDYNGVKFSSIIWIINNQLIFSNSSFISPFSGFVLTNTNDKSYYFVLSNKNGWEPLQTISNIIICCDYNNNFSTNIFAFVTESDKFPPNITFIYPTNNSSNISRNPDIEFIISDNYSLNFNSIKVLVNNELAIVEGAPISPYSFLLQTNTGNKLTNVYIKLYQINSEFHYNTNINIQVFARDIFGNNQSNSTVFYTIEDYIYPDISLVYPVNYSSNNDRTFEIIIDSFDDYFINPQLFEISIIIQEQTNYVLVGTNFQEYFSGKIESLSRNQYGFITNYRITFYNQNKYNYNQDLILTIKIGDINSNFTYTNFYLKTKYDDIPPYVFDIYPKNNQTGIDNNENISFNVGDNYEVIQLQISNLILYLNNDIILSNNIWNPNYSGFYSNNLSNGFYFTITNHPYWEYKTTNKLIIIVFDSFSNITIFTNTFYVKNDDIPPEITFLDPQINSTNINRNQEFTIRIIDDYNIDIDTLSININGNNAVIKGIPQNNYNFTIITNSINSLKDITLKLKYLLPFDYKENVDFKINVNDIDKNLKSLSSTFTVKEDDVNPSINIIKPLPNSKNNLKNDEIIINLIDDFFVNLNSLIIKINNELVVSNKNIYGVYNNNISEIKRINQSNYQVTLYKLYKYGDNINVNLTFSDLNNNALQTNYNFWISNDYISPLLTYASPSYNSIDVDISKVLYYEIADEIMIDTNSLVITIEEIGFTNIIAFSNNNFNNYYLGNKSKITNFYSNNNHYLIISLNKIENFKLSNDISVNITVYDTNNNKFMTNLIFRTGISDINKPMISYLFPEGTNIEPNELIKFVLSDDSGIVKNSINLEISYENNKYIAISNGIIQTGFYGEKSSIKTNILKGYDIIIEPEFNFPYSTIINAKVFVKDIYDNTNIAEWNWTVRPPDTTPPVITPIYPKDMESNINIDTIISIEITDNYKVPSNFIIIHLNNELVLSNGKFNISFENNMSTMKENSQGGFLINFRKNIPLEYSYTNKVSVIAIDNSFNTNTLEFSFITFDKRIAFPKNNVAVVDKNNNDNKKVKFIINRFGNFSARIYNLQGQLIAEIPQKPYQIGDIMEWDPEITTGVFPGSGIYIIEIIGDNITYRTKFALIK